MYDTLHTRTTEPEKVMPYKDKKERKRQGKQKNLKKQPLPDHETDRKTFWPSLNEFRRQSKSPEYPVKARHVITRGQTGNRTNRTVSSVHSDKHRLSRECQNEESEKGIMRVHG